MAPVFDDLAELVIQGLDRVRGVDDLADFGWEGQEGNEPLPGVLPGGHGRRVTAAQLETRRRPTARTRRPRRWAQCRSGATPRRRACGLDRTQTASRPESGARCRSAPWSGARWPRW